MTCDPQAQGGAREASRWELAGSAYLLCPPLGPPLAPPGSPWLPLAPPGSSWLPLAPPAPLAPLGSQSQDGYFACPASRFFGVADGVGGWADNGVDPGSAGNQGPRRSQG